MTILTTKEFIAFYKTSFKTIKKGPWIIHYALGMPTPKIGISVSKKVFKRAVKRNKSKRHIKEWLRNEALQSGYFNIILSKPLDFNKDTLDKAKVELLSLLVNLK